MITSLLSTNSPLSEYVNYTYISGFYFRSPLQLVKVTF